MAKKYKNGILCYNSSNDRYGIITYDGWINSLHCGDSLEIKIKNKWIKTTMEMAWGPEGGQWYLTGTPYRGKLPGMEARIAI